MKILYCAFDPVPFPKGSGSRIEATVRALAQAGAQVVLHTPLPKTPMEGFAERLEGLNIEHRPIEVLEENFLDRVLAFRRSVELILECERFEAAIFRSPWEGIPILKRVRLPIYEVHGFPSTELPSHFPAIRNRPEIMDRLIGEENLCLAHARLLVTPSQTSRRYLMRRGVHPDKIRVVPNSFDSSQVTADGSPLELGEVVRIGYMGTLAPWQGLETLLEALALSRRQERTYRLVLAGTRKGRWARRLRELTVHLRLKETLEMHGPLPKEQLFELLRGCHVLAAPLPDDPRNGMQGCCPIKILEYMACQRPILSTRIPPVEEILCDGVSATLVPPNSAAWLARGLEKILSDYEGAQQLAVAAKQRLDSHFPRARFSRQLHDLKQELERLKSWVST